MYLLRLWYNISIILFHIVNHIFHRFLLFAWVFLSSSLASWIYSILTSLWGFVSDIQDKNFPTLHLWLVLLFFWCVARCLHFWSCQGNFSFLFHHVIKNSPCSDRLILKCYFRRTWYNFYMCIFLIYWLSRQIKLTVHEIIES